MKKTLFMLCAVVVIAFTSTGLFATADAATTRYCPNSGVKCEVTTTNPDGSSTTIKSEKGKNDDAVIIS